MAEPLTLLPGLRASTADLLAGLEKLAWSESDVAAPSLCAGWSRGHVLTHIARNADGISDTLAGALRGEVVERYPGGGDARNAAIDAGARRPFDRLTADVRESAERLDRMLAAVEDADGWALPTDEGHPAAYWVAARWKEVEIHWVDLDAGHTPDRWPPALVRAIFEPLIDRLDGRVDSAVRVTVSASGSLLPDFVDRVWTAGSGDPIEVTGPDWAVLAWLVGRPTTAAAALTATPALGQYS